MNTEFVNAYTKYLETCIINETNNARKGIISGNDIEIVMCGKAARVLREAWCKFKELVTKDLEEQSKNSITYILEFEVIKPDNELETIGEKLKLSAFGEYCPDNSLRGYSLYFLLLKPENYRVSKIIQKGISYSLKY